MDIGVSTACLYPLETEKSLFEIASRGIKNAELFINSVDEAEGKIFEEIKSIIKSYDMNITSFHPFSSPMETLFLFGDYKRREDYLLDIYKRYFEKMGEIGADIFVLHGAILSSKVPDDRYLERYLRLYRTAKQFGITVVQENVCYCKSKSIEFLTKMSRELGDEVRFVIDLKQARRSGVDPFLLLNALGNKVIHLHVSDGNKECDCLPVGEGDFDFDRLMKHLQSLSYNGALVVELYRNNYEGYDELVHSANRLSRFASAYNFQISP